MKDLGEILYNGYLALDLHSLPVCTVERIFKIEISAARSWYNRENLHFGISLFLPHIKVLCHRRCIEHFERCLQTNIKEMSTTLLACMFGRTHSRNVNFGIRETEDTKIMGHRDGCFFWFFHKACLSCSLERYV